ncbi:hypothetical protein [Kineosporia succinea]|uniref:Uncharacterized protein n=1 Tax=Kineosporia succinea TaxID=84632 RepID=A0ABT9P9R7_9ACTN|nr:hypothetical protein [Kineosporia succinea]MDP9829435.1 hypothetical protein [Kineosporia succinea]
MTYTKPAPATDGQTPYNAARDQHMQDGIFAAAQVADEALAAAGAAQSTASGAASALTGKANTSDVNTAFGALPGTYGPGGTAGNISATDAAGTALIFSLIGL